LCHNESDHSTKYALGDFQYLLQIEPHAPLFESTSGAGKLESPVAIVDVLNQDYFSYYRDPKAEFSRSSKYTQPFRRVTSCPLPAKGSIYLLAWNGNTTEEYRKENRNGQFGDEARKTYDYK
jgi:hypothetical protein